MEYTLRQPYHKVGFCGIILLLCILLNTSVHPAAASPPHSTESQAAVLAARFKAIIGGRKLAVSVIPASAVYGIAQTGYQDDQLYAVASAFKGPVALYFFEHVDPSVWRAVPVQYWSLKTDTKVPAEYRVAWNTYRTLYYDLFQMAIRSENDATGRILTYVWKTTSAAQLGDNPLTAFNTWSHNTVGIGAQSGMRAWLVGESICPKCKDDRYEAQPFIYARRIFYLNNTYTAKDLARYWVYLAQEGRRLGYFDVAETLMKEQEYGLVHKTTLKYGFEAITKDGYIAPNSENGNGYRISTDAGLLILPDGEEYAVAYMAFDSGDLIEPSVSMMSQLMLESMRAAF